MEAVTDLMSPTSEADVLEWAATSPGMSPEAKDPLICLPKLPGSGEDATAVDPNRKVEGHAVLEGEKLRAFLG
jgi:hypothetical protein